MLRMSNSNRKRIRKNFQQFDRSVSPPQFASQSAASRRVDGLPEPLSIPESEDQMNSARVRRATADVPSEPLLVPESEDSTDRLRRSPGDEFTKLLANLQALARVSTGVALEIGLVNQSIDPTIVIAELLRMGSVKPDDIIGLEDNVIKNALAEMDKLKKVPADGVVNMEDRLKTLDEMRKKASEFKNLPVKTYLDNYKASLKKVGDLGKLEKKLNDLITFTQQALSPLSYLKNQEGIFDEDNSVMVVKNMKRLYENLETIEGQAQSFDQFSTPLEEAKRIVDDSKFIDVFLDEDKLRTSLNDNNAKFDGPDVATILADIQAASTDEKNAEDLRTSLDIITKLLTTKDRLHRQVYQYTSGLPRGVADLEQLSLSAGNEWIANRVQDNSTVAQSLEKAFASFFPLTTSLKNTEKAWSPLEKPENREEVLDVINLLFQMTDGSSQSGEIEKTINELKTCDGSAKDKPTGLSEKLLKAKEKVATLSDAVGKISDFQYIDQLKNLTTVKEHFNVASKKDENDKKELAKRTLSILATDKDILNLKEKLDQLQEDLESFAGVAKNATSITNINLSYLEQHQKILSMDNYHKIFTCLESIQVNGPSVEEMIKFRQDIRSFSLPPNAKSTIDAIIGSGTSLSDAKTVAGKLKDVKDREVTSLKTAYEGMNDPALGMAVQGLVAINKVKNVRKQLEPLLKLKSIPIGGLTPDQQKAIEDLQKLPEVFESIDVFLNKSPELNVYRRKRSAADFKSIKPIFDAANQIKGVEINMKHLREALEALQQTTPNTYDEAVKAMDILETLDLNFARFSIRNATLGGLDDFFKKYGIEMSRVSVPVTAPNPRTGVIADNSTETSPNFPLLTVLLSSFGGFCLILVVIGGVVLCLCCRKKPSAILPPPPPPPPPPVPSPLPADDEEKIKIDSKVAEKPKPPVVEELHTPLGMEDDVATAIEAPPRPPVEENMHTARGLAPRPPIPDPPMKGPELTDEEIISMFSGVMDAITFKMKKDLITPTTWAQGIIDLLDKQTNNMITKQWIEKREERRYDGIYCNPQTMAKLAGYEGKAGYFHGNVMMLKGVKILMTQGPMDEEDVRLKLKKVVTCHKHWAAIDYNDVALSVQLCGEYENETVKGVVIRSKKCGKYYPTEKDGVLEFGRYTIKCLDVIKNLPNFDESCTNDFTLYKLQYTNKETKVTKQTDIVQYTGWVDHGGANPGAILQLIKFIETYNATTLVHCSAGVGRTGTLVTIMYGLDVCLREKIPLIQIVSRVREYRFGAVHVPEQYLLLFVCILKGVMAARNIDYCKEYSAFRWFLNHIQDYETMEQQDAEKKLEEEKNKKNKKTDSEIQKEYEDRKEIFRKQNKEMGDFIKKEGQECKGKKVVVNDESKKGSQKRSKKNKSKQQDVKPSGQQTKPPVQDK